MKKICIFVVSLFYCFTSYASEETIFSQVYQLIIDEHINDIQISSVFSPVFSAIELDDKDIDVVVGKNSTTVYYKGKIHKVYSHPTDEKDAKKWGMFTNHLLSEVKKISPSLDHKDFELTDIMLYHGIKEFDKDAKYFPTLDIGQPIEKIQPYASSLQDNNILYIRLGTINEYTANQFLQTVSSYPNSQGVILDLRGNKGGYLKYALDVADAFLSKGVMIYTIGRYVGKPKIYKATDGEFFKGKPIAVLVDGETASAAEIIAIALQKNNRAIIIGSQTYGKGTVQNIFTLDNGGGIALTTEEFLGFDKVIIDKTGLKPDICSSFYETADDLDNILAKDVAHLECPKIVNNSSIDEEIANKYILYPIQ